MSSTSGMMGAHHHHGGGAGAAMLQSVLAALGQTGVNLAGLGQPASSANPSGSDADGSSQVTAAGSASPQQAMRGFMMSLYSSINASGGSAASNAYGSDQNGLASLISQVSAASTSGSGSAAVASLQSSFQNLTQSLGSGSSANSSLLTFLQNMQQQMAGQGLAMSGTGSTLQQTA